MKLTKKDRKFIESHIDLARILAYQKARKALPLLTLREFFTNQMPHNVNYAEQKEH